MIGKTNSVIVSGGGENTLKNLLDATKSAKYLFNGYQGEGVNTLIQPNDTENVTNMNYMFNNCNNITAIPSFSTSNVTDMSYMFNNCNNLTEIPQFDTSKVTNMTSMFVNCVKLTTIPLLDTSTVYNMGYMFSGCAKLTTVPLLDTSNVTGMRNMFSNCTDLTTVPALNVDKVTMANYLQNIFSGCTNLKSILMTNIGVNLNISASTKFERSDLLVILNNLKTVTSTTKLTMGADNLAKLTDEDKAIATNKGWTLA